MLLNQGLLLGPNKQLYRFERHTDLSLPLFLTPVRAGFPSPASDYIEAKLDLNEYLVKHPSATYFLKVVGDSMTGLGIHSGDIVIADRSLDVVNHSVVIAIVEGEFTVKRLSRHKGKLYLVPANPDYQPLEITPEMDFAVWGVVTHVIHPV